MPQPASGNKDPSLREALSLGRVQVLGSARPVVSAERDRNQIVVN